MTNTHDQDAFEIRFESALDDMHTRTHRGAAPSATAWQKIQTGLSGQYERAEAADPRALGPDPAPVSRRTHRMRKESDMDLALTPALRSPQPRMKRGMFAWVAIALVGVLMASSVYWFGQPPPGNDEGQLAWAPGIGTPESSPMVQAMETACSVEPLSADEVMETVLNPNMGYLRLGSSQAANSNSLWEPSKLIHDPNLVTDDDLEAVNDSEKAEALTLMGNEYWLCLREGSSYQVWSLLDPILVQRFILDEFPVLRTEEQIRTYVEEAGPRPFMEAGPQEFTSLIQFDQAGDAQVIEGEDALLFTPEIDSPLPRIQHGVILLSSSSFSNHHFALYVTEIAPDVWMINDVAPVSIEE